MSEACRNVTEFQVSAVCLLKSLSNNLPPYDVKSFHGREDMSIIFDFYDDVKIWLHEDAFEIYHYRNEICREIYDFKNSAEMLEKLFEDIRRLLLIDGGDGS